MRAAYLAAPRGSSTLRPSPRIDRSCAALRERCAAATSAAVFGGAGGVSRSTFLSRTRSPAACRASTGRPANAGFVASRASVSRSSALLVCGPVPVREARSLRLLAELLTWSRLVRDPCLLDKRAGANWSFTGWGESRPCKAAEP